MARRLVLEMGGREELLRGRCCTCTFLRVVLYIAYLLLVRLSTNKAAFYMEDSSHTIGEEKAPAS